MSAKHFKSLLFVPVSRLDIAERAHERGADAIILDLEDGVADADKVSAREVLGSLMESLRQKQVATLLRINALDAGGVLDIEAIPDGFAPSLVLPKVSHQEQIADVENCWTSSGRELSSLQLLPMIECPRGMFSSQHIATASPSVSALIFGGEDFAAAAGTSTDMDALAMPAQWVTLAAAAAGIPSYGLPGSLANYQDMALFEATVQRAKTIGFTGALCVHPKQVLHANKVFQPGQQDLEWARAVVAQSGSGGATGGEVGMVDAPVLARARAILQRSE